MELFYHDLTHFDLNLDLFILVQPVSYVVVGAAVKLCIVGKSYLNIF